MIRRCARPVLRWLSVFGVNPLVFLQGAREIPRFLGQLRELRRQGGVSVHPMRFGSMYPCLSNRSERSGSASGHYFHQDLLVARRIFSLKPSVHIDVGSRIDGFVAHVASYRPILVLDIRPQLSAIPNITFVQCDIMGAVPANLVGAADCVSCLHSLEHFGLGRYGDPLSFDGYLVGLNNLFQMASIGGTVFVSVPIGPERIEFNAHRVFAIDTMSRLLREMSSIRAFSYVDDLGDLHEDVSVDCEGASRNFGCHYGCGIWECEKV